MLADMRLGQQAGPTPRRQLGPRADAGEHQQVRRTDRPGAEDHLLVRVYGMNTADRVAVLDAPGGQLSAIAVEQQARGVGTRDDAEVRPALRFAFKEGVIRARPPA